MMVMVVKGMTDKDLKHKESTEPSSKHLISGNQMIEEESCGFMNGRKEGRKREIERNGKGGLKRKSANKGE